MLYSPAARVAFAHYPKTAGCSITEWFQRVFPEAAHVDPDNPHVPVRASLELLGLVSKPRPRPRLVRECLRVVRRVVPGMPARSEPCDVRIIGVVREPFEMLVSLYEYWRRYDFSVEPAVGLIRTARTGTFRQFLELAVGERQLVNYETHFDVGGPAWAGTRLLDFQSLEPALETVCAEFGIEASAGLGCLNAAPRRRRDVGGYLAEAGSLVFEVRSYFRWYYEEATRIMIRGRQARLLRAA